MAAARWTSASVICAGRLRETGEVYTDLPDDVLERGLAVPDTTVVPAKKPAATKDEE